MSIQPYLFYAGRCEEAIDFYRRTLGAQPEMVMRMKDSPAPQPGNMPPGSEDKIMHAALRIGEAQLLMSDGMCEGQPRFEGFGLSLTAGDAGTAQRYFNGLAEGGQVRMPLSKTFFADNFGMVADRFGVLWMIVQGQPK
ncbi:MAG TPA: VOC family protein [Casimicrobiaceae bacterium]|nr:VOC family protein [Casimicrobiaceae bacterium]